MEITSETTTTDICIAYSDADALDNMLRTEVETNLSRIERLHELMQAAKLMMEADIRHARSAGATWAQIGDVFGITRQSAHERFGREADADLIDRQ